MVHGDAYSVEVEIINECGLPELIPAEYGGTVGLQYMPHALVGNYFVEVS